MSVPHPEVSVDPVVALISQRMTSACLNRKKLGHLLSAGNPSKAFRRLDHLLREEQFVLEFIKKVAEVLQIPSEQLAVAWDAHEEQERKRRAESSRRAVVETMERRGPHLWGRLPRNYHPSLITVLGAEFFLLVRLPEEFAELSSYEMIRDVGQAVREHYQNDRRCRLIGYDYRKSLDEVYRFDTEGEYVSRIEEEPLDSRTFVKIGTQTVETPGNLLRGGNTE